MGDCGIPSGLFVGIILAMSSMSLSNDAVPVE